MMADELILEPGQRVYHYIYSADTNEFMKRYAYILSVHDDFVWLDEYDPHTLRFFKSPKRIKLHKKSFEKVLFRKNIYLWSTEDSKSAYRIIDVYLYRRFKNLYNNAITCAAALTKFREKKCPSNEE